MKITLGLLIFGLSLAVKAANRACKDAPADASKCECGVKGTAVLKSSAASFWGGSRKDKKSEVVTYITECYTLCLFRLRNPKTHQDDPGSYCVECNEELLRHDEVIWRSSKKCPLQKDSSKTAPSTPPRTTKEEPPTFTPQSTSEETQSTSLEIEEVEDDDDHLKDDDDHVKEDDNHAETGVGEIIVKTIVDAVVPVFKSDDQHRQDMTQIGDSVSQASKAIVAAALKAMEMTITGAKVAKDASLAGAAAGLDMVGTATAYGKQAATEAIGAATPVASRVAEVAYGTAAGAASTGVDVAGRAVSYGKQAATDAISAAKPVATRAAEVVYEGATTAAEATATYTAEKGKSAMKAGRAAVPIVTDAAKKGFEEAKNAAGAVASYTRTGAAETGKLALKAGQVAAPIVADAAKVSYEKGTAAAGVAANYAARGAVGTGKLAFEAGKIAAPVVASVAAEGAIRGTQVGLAGAHLLGQAAVKGAKMSYRLIIDGSRVAATVYNAVREAQREMQELKEERDFDAVVAEAVKKSIEQYENTVPNLDDEEERRVADFVDNEFNELEGRKRRKPTAKLGGDAVSRLKDWWRTKEPLEPRLDEKSTEEALNDIIKKVSENPPKIGKLNPDQTMLSIIKKVIEKSQAKAFEQMCSRKGWGRVLPMSEWIEIKAPQKQFLGTEEYINRGRSFTLFASIYYIDGNEQTRRAQIIIERYKLDSTSKPTGAPLRVVALQLSVEGLENTYQHHNYEYLITLLSSIRIGEFQNNLIQIAVATTLRKRENTQYNLFETTIDSAGMAGSTKQFWQDLTPTQFMRTYNQFKSTALCI